MPFRKGLKHLDEIIMAGEKPVTKKTFAGSLLKETFEPTSYSGAVARGMQANLSEEAAKRYGSLIGNLGTTAGLAETVAKLLKKRTVYPKKLKERRRLILGLGALTAGTGAGAGITANQLVEVLKKKRKEASLGKR